MLSPAQEESLYEEVLKLWTLQTISPPLRDQLTRVCPETYTAISVLDADFLVFPAGALFGWSSRWKHQSVPVCAVDFQNLK